MKNSLSLRHKKSCNSGQAPFKNIFFVHFKFCPSVILWTLRTIKGAKKNLFKTKKKFLSTMDLLVCYSLVNSKTGIKCKITECRTDGPMDQQTDRVTYRVTCMQLTRPYTRQHQSRTLGRGIDGSLIAVWLEFCG